MGSSSKSILLGFWVAIAICLSCCSKSADEAALPMYLEISQPEILVRPAEGSSTHLVTEAWIYADSIFLGVFPIPSRAPLLSEGQVTLDVFAGIRANGLAADIDIYPFYEPSRHQITFERLSSVAIEPRFAYDTNLKIAFVEGFDQGNLFGQDLDGDPGTIIQRAADGSLDGMSGRVTLTADHQMLEVASELVYDQLPMTGAAVYLELDYRSDVPISVGTRRHGGGAMPQVVYKLILFPDAEWQKIYVNFTEDIRASNASGYQIVFQAAYDIGGLLEIQTVYLDNIKLLHF